MARYINYQEYIKKKKIRRPGVHAKSKTSKLKKKKKMNAKNIVMVSKNVLID